MYGKKLIRKSLTFLTAVAVWSAFSMSIIAAPGDRMGEIIVSGQVSVDGQSVVSNSTIISGSTIATGANSSAVINLGKNGRVEIFSDATVSLKFTNNSIVGILSSGKVEVSNSAGIATSFTTKNATVVADSGQTNTFSIDVGCADEERCTQTYVETTVGLAILKNGATDKQVAAGTDATLGNPSQTGCKPCLRPGLGAPIPIAGIGSGLVGAILVGIGGVVGAAILLNRRNRNTIDLGGTVTVLSPSR
ncbi:MAG: hypothetical protein WKF90_05140 [Pyrinomonadaceae bacterium]